MLAKWRRRKSGLAQDVLKLDQEVNIQAHGEDQEGQSDDGKGTDATANGAQVFNQLLLLEGITVGGFADPLELIFDTLEAGGLFNDLRAQFAMAGADFGQSTLDGLEVYVNLSRRWRWWMMNWLRGDERSDGGGKVAVE